MPNDTLARQDIMDQRKESIERENYAGERGIMIDKDKVKVSISLNFEFIDQEDDK